MGFEPDYQVIVEWEAVGEIVDAMDGVWFDVPRDMDYDDPYQDLSIHSDKGYQLSNRRAGHAACIRYRQDNECPTATTTATSAGSRPSRRS